MAAWAGPWQKTSSDFALASSYVRYASSADSRYGEFAVFIEKKVIDGSTVTLIDNLQREGMVKEIARLSGSLGVSENALAAADELKRWCEDYVKEISH